MSKNIKEAQEKIKAERKFRENIEEKKKERELFLSNRAMSRAFNKAMKTTIDNRVK